MIVLLDTTVLIDALRNKRNRRALLAELAENGHILATSSINLGEVYSGMRPQEKPQTDTFLDSLECYPLTSVIARRAGSLKHEWAQRGWILTLADMVVAATALEYSLVLMTDNSKDFPLPELNFHPLP